MRWLRIRARNMDINKQTRLWALSHISLLALVASLGACTTVDDPGAYTLCTPTPPATTCGDNVDIQVK